MSIRKAAKLLVERCKMVDACLRDPIANGYDGATTRCAWRAAVKNLENALDEPSDDDEPITKGIVNAGEFRIFCFGDDESVSYVQIEDTPMSSINLDTIKTKGQLRRLVAVLRGDPC